MPIWSSGFLRLPQAIRVTNTKDGFTFLNNSTRLKPCLNCSITNSVEKNSLKYIVSKLFLPAMVTRCSKLSLVKLLGEVLYKCVNGKSPKT